MATFLAEYVAATGLIDKVWRDKSAIETASRTPYTAC